MAASEDVWLEDDGNHNADAFFIVGKSRSATVDDPEKRTIIKFYLSQAVPTTATVLNAQMKLYCSQTGLQSGGLGASAPNLGGLKRSTGHEA